MSAEPAPMHPYYRAIVEAYAASGRPFFHQLSPAEARELLRTSLAAAPAPVDLPAIGAVTQGVVEGPHGPIPIRLYAPPGEAVGTIVYLHSGGWVIGGIDQPDPLCRRIVAATGCALVSVDYRLAPEHPYPQPLDDAYAVVEWAAEAMAGPLLLLGESAGGNLAAACAIRARDTGGPAIAGQILAYPVTDCDLDSASYREVGECNWLLSTADMQWFWDHYCPREVDRTHAWLSPLRVADAAGLPPAFIAVAALDPLREEGLAYARKLAAAGVPVVSRCDAGMLHGYWAAAGIVEVATEALALATHWIGERVHLAGEKA